MDKKIISLFLLIIGFGSFLQAAGDARGNSTSKWQIVSESNGIQVLERWITNEKNLKVRERTGKMTLNCSLEDVVNLIADTEKSPNWMSSTESAKRLKTCSDKEWFVHTIIDAPWPFNKQDMVSKYEVKELDDKNTIQIVITKEESLLPPQKDMDRLDTFNAIWTIETLKKGKVRVTFTTQSTQPPKYPTWAQDPVVRKVFFSNLKNFKALINKA